VGSPWLLIIRREKKVAVIREDLSGNTHSAIEMSFRDGRPKFSERECGNVY
jgi:hypothetical protein